MCSQRIAVVGATGNIGTSLVQALSEDDRVSSILGIARRIPEWEVPKLEMATADQGQDDLTELFSGCDAVVHLGWLFQPTHDPSVTWQTNVLGSLRVFEAASRSGAGALIYSSSVGAYSPGTDAGAVTESWPTHGWPGAAYTREKSYLERVLDLFEHENPSMRVVRMRPGFVFKRESASEQRRLFAGPLLPGALVQSKFIPAVPELADLHVQAVHAADVADAFRLATLSGASGPYNVAAEPVMDTDALAYLLGARTVPVSSTAVRAVLSAAWQLHAVPASPGLFDAVRHLPLMDTTRARVHLGWTPH